MQTKNSFAPIKFDKPGQAPSQVVGQECRAAPWVAWLDEDFSNAATGGGLIEYGTHSLQNKLVVFCRSGSKGSTIEVDKVALCKS